jgi:hypothetical protein
VILGHRAPNDAGIEIADGSSSGADVSPADGWTPPIFGNVSLVAGLGGTTDESENPSLTRDLLQMFFSSTRSGSGDVYCASRSAADASFDTPTKVGVFATADVESSPAISPDGVTLWAAVKLGSDAGDQSDIFASRRSNQDAGDWSSPTSVTELNSSEDDIPRPLGNLDRTMPLGSRRDGSHFLTYLATRPSSGDPFGKPVHESELDDPDPTFNTADAFLTDDGLTIYFTRAAGGLGDIYVAHRGSADQAFDTPQPLPGINSPVCDERDPWLSADEKLLFFASNCDPSGTSGPLVIYQAALKP